MAGFYNRGKYLLATGGLAWTSADVRALLVTSSYTFNADHNVVTDVTAFELSGGSGYARKTTTRTVVEDDTNDRADLTVADLTWTGINAGTPAGIILYKHNAADGSAELVSYHDFPATATNGGDLTVAFAATTATRLA